MKIVAMTVCCTDIYPQIGKKCVGGNSVNFATQCSRSGVAHVSVLGAVGNDSNGADIKNHLRKHKIDCSHVHVVEGATASNDIYLADTGETTSRPDSWRGGVYQTFRLSRADWDFVRAHEVVAVISVDPNFRATFTHLTPSSKLVVDFLDTRDFALIEDVLPKTDIAFISGDDEVVQQLVAMSQRIGTLMVVTLGKRGSIALHGGLRCVQEAVAVAQVVDVTGCGDAYQAAFTIAWFAGKGVQAAMAAGAAAAAQILTHLGGV